MSDIPFTNHRQDAIPLDRNVAPIPECRVNPILQNGKVIKVVDVKILSCASVWLRCQREAEQWISDCDGQVMRAMPEMVNARINAAYAYLWLTDQRFQWAGLAAFASKQVGCGLLHSATLVGKAEARLAAAPKILGGVILPDDVFDKATADAAKYMKQQLALANRTLFLDIYPLHRFYTLRGMNGLRNCLAERQGIRSQVEWDTQEKLPFGLPFKEILAGFDAIERGDLAESVRQLAFHEQVNVLQAILYDQTAIRVLLDGNQAAWVTGLPSSGYYQELQLTLSAQCKAKSDLTTMFKRSLAVKLYDKDDRMEFVYRAAESFDKLVRKRPSDIKRSMREIFSGRGIR